MCHEKFDDFWHLKKHLSSHNSKNHRIELERQAYMSSQHIPAIRDGADLAKKGPKNAKTPCSICGKKFKGEHLLAQHAMTHVDRKLTEVQCETCGKWLKNQKILRAHEVTHDRLPLQCPHCDKVKFNERALGAHIFQCHSKLKNKCKLCGKSFVRPNNLKVRLVRQQKCFESLLLISPIIFSSLPAGTHGSKPYRRITLWMRLLLSIIQK